MENWVSDGYEDWPDPEAEKLVDEAAELADDEAWDDLAEDWPAVWGLKPYVELLEAA